MGVFDIFPVYFMLFDTWCFNKETKQLEFIKAGRYIGDEWVPVLSEGRSAMMELPSCMEEDKVDLLKVRKNRVLTVAKENPEAKRILKKLFPEAFEDEWVNITPFITIKCEHAGGSGTIDNQKMYIRLYHNDNMIAKLIPAKDGIYNSIDWYHKADKEKYKIKVTFEGGIQFFKRDE